MANTEYEDQIIEQIEHFEYKLPELKEDTRNAFLWGVIGSVAASATIVVGYEIDEMIDNRLGALPEATSILTASSAAAIGALGIFASIVSGVQYINEKRRGSRF